jgi:MFS family permease
VAVDGGSVSRQSVSARVASTVDALRGDGRGWVLLAVSTGWLLGLGIRLVFPAVLPYIRAEFGMDLPTAGLLLSALWAGYALMQFPGGLAADRFGERNVLVTGIAVTTVGVLGVVVAPDVESFFVGTVLVGLGMGMFGTTRITILSDVFPERSGTAIGFNQAAGNVGTTVMPAAAGFLAVYVGWRWGFGVSVPFFALVAGLLWTALPSRTSTPAAFGRTDLRASLRHLRRAVSHPSVVYVTLTMMMASFIYQGFTGFFPTYLDAQKGLDAELAATLLGVFFATAVVVQPVAGMVRDRFGARRTLVGILVSTALFLAVLSFAEGLPALVTVTVLLSVQLAFWPVGNSYVADVVPDDIQGTTVGLSRTFFLLVGAAGPTFVGVAADAGGFDEAFLALAAVALVGVVPALRLGPADG